MVIFGEGCVVGTGHALSLQNPGQKRFQNVEKNSISSIVGSYKSAVTKHANRLNFDIGWQSRFHDHIIRNEGEYWSIVDYINSNPKKWEQDKFFKIGEF